MEMRSYKRRVWEFDFATYVMLFFNSIYLQQAHNARVQRGVIPVQQSR